MKGIKVRHKASNIENEKKANLSIACVGLVDGGDYIRKMDWRSVTGYLSIVSGKQWICIKIGAGC
jgi:hypothetical protein